MLIDSFGAINTGYGWGSFRVLVHSKKRSKPIVGIKNKYERRFFRQFLFAA